MNNSTRVQDRTVAMGKAFHGKLDCSKFKNLKYLKNF